MKAMCEQHAGCLAVFLKLSGPSTYHFYMKPRVAFPRDFNRCMPGQVFTYSKSRKMRFFYKYFLENAHMSKNWQTRYLERQDTRAKRGDTRYLAHQDTTHKSNDIRCIARQGKRPKRV